MGSYFGISETKKNTIEDIIYDIANRLKSPERVQNNMINLKKQWNIASLAEGYPGIILLFAELNNQYPDQGWDRIIFDYMVALVNLIKDNGIKSISLFTGLSGINYCVYITSSKFESCRILLDKLDYILLKEVHKFMDYIKFVKNQRNTGNFEFEYDLISGLTGVGRYLLARYDVPDFYDILTNVLNYLVSLTKRIEVNGFLIPGWYVINDGTQKLFNNGYFNCGLAHGIPGPLSLLSLCLKYGIIVEGQKEAIRSIVDWLLYWEQEDEFGVFWPLKISFNEEITGELNNYSQRMAWCYGMPGVLRSLYLAGEALNDTALIDCVIGKFWSMFNRPEEKWNIFSPIICHGTAGLLQLAIKMARKCNDDESLNVHIIYLTDQLINFYKPSTDFGFQDLQRVNGNSKYINNAGFLGGASGIALVFLSLIARNKYMWDQLLLIE